jgi:hypothetical protein
MGCHNLDLDCRDFLHERPRTRHWNELSDAECRKHCLPTVLPNILSEMRLVRKLSPLTTFSANTPSSYTFYFFAGVDICLAFFVFFFIPETRRVSLEEMDVLFGGSNHVEKGSNMLYDEDSHPSHVRMDSLNSAGGFESSPNEIAPAKPIQYYRQNRFR